MLPPAERKELFDMVDMPPIRFSDDELRKICEEAIGRGEDYELARREARYRRMRNALLVVLCGIGLLLFWFYSRGWRTDSDRSLRQQSAVPAQPPVAPKLVSPLRLAHSRI